MADQGAVAEFRVILFGRETRSRSAAGFAAATSVPSAASAALALLAATDSLPLRSTQHVRCDARHRFHVKQQVICARPTRGPRREGSADFADLKPRPGPARAHFSRPRSEDLFARTSSVSGIRPGLAALVGHEAEGRRAILVC